MIFGTIIEKVKKIKILETRKEVPGYLEVVIHVETSPELQVILEECFGRAFKPAGQAPSADVKKKTQLFGGIWQDQTLYLREEGGNFYCAMLWPWADKTTITVKIGCYQLKDK